MTRECVTHHYACDCREAAHTAELAAARDEVERLRAKVADLSLRGLVQLSEDLGLYDDDK